MHGQAEPTMVVIAPPPTINEIFCTIPCFAPSHLPPLLKVRCCRPKKFGRLPEGLPHHHPSLAPTLPNPHYPLLCTTTLASLVKGEVLSPEKIRATTGGIAAPTLAPHQPFQNRTLPRKPPTPLPPLSKGGGLTARHKPLYWCFLLVPRPPFLFTKPFCRQDGGIASPPFALRHILTTPCQR